MPRIFHVNWFRKDASGKFLWPGFGENSRVLKWMFERIDEKAPARITPIGYVPTAESLDLSGINVSKEALAQLLDVDANAWKKEAADLETYFSMFGNHLPQGIKDELSALQSRLQ
jgi:phosphoenolpyruvate carboxykinase (GTP)